MRHVFQAFIAAMLLNTVLFFIADTTDGKWLHAVAAISFGIAAVATRPKTPPNLR